MKICKICKEEKELSLAFFYANGKSKDGYNSYCKECDKKAAKERYEKIKADPVLRKQHSERICGYIKTLRAEAKSALKNGKK